MDSQDLQGLQANFKELQLKVCKTLEDWVAKGQPVERREKKEMKSMMVDLFCLSDSLTCADKTDQWYLWTLQANNLQTDVNVVIEDLGTGSPPQAQPAPQPQEAIALATRKQSQDLRVDVTPHDGLNAAKYSPDVEVSSSKPLFPFPSTTTQITLA